MEEVKVDAAAGPRMRQSRATDLCIRGPDVGGARIRTATRGGTGTRGTEGRERERFFRGCIGTIQGYREDIVYAY